MNKLAMSDSNHLFNILGVDVIMHIFSFVDKTSIDKLYYTDKTFNEFIRKNKDYIEKICIYKNPHGEVLDYWDAKQTKLMYRETYYNGVLHGDFELYNEDTGELEYWAVFKHGKLQKETKNFVLNRTFVIFHKDLFGDSAFNWEIIVRGSSIENKKWHSNGAPHCHNIHRCRPGKNRVSFEWYDNGTIATIWEYLDDGSVYRGYDIDGNLRKYIKQTSKSFDIKRWDKNGVLILNCR